MKIRIDLYTLYLGQCKQVYTLIYRHSHLVKNDHPLYLIFHFCFDDTDRRTRKHATRTIVLLEIVFCIW